MNFPGQKMKLDKMPASWEALTVAAYVPEAAATKIQKANLDLYRECVGQILEDWEMQVHVLMMPEMRGTNLVYTADEEEDIAASVEAITGTQVGALDMIVVIGKDLLDREVGEDEMLEIAMNDLAVHLDKLWPVADRTAGWAGKHIGWAAVAATISGAHGVLRLLEPAEAIMERIQDAANSGMVGEIRMKSGKMELMMEQNRTAFEAVRVICRTAFDTYGDYLPLPADGRRIAETAKAIFLQSTDSLPASPRGVL